MWHCGECSCSLKYVPVTDFFHPLFLVLNLHNHSNKKVMMQLEGGGNSIIKRMGYL